MRRRVGRRGTSVVVARAARPAKRLEAAAAAELALAQAQRLRRDLEQLVRADPLQALLEAVRRFRPGRGTPFATYAAWWIRHAIVHALASHASTVRLSMHVRRLLAQYITVRETLTRERDRPPGAAELAEHLGQPVAQVEELELLRQQHAQPLGTPGRDAKDLR